MMLLETRLEGVRVPSTEHEGSRRRLGSPGVPGPSHCATVRPAPLWARLLPPGGPLLVLGLTLAFWVWSVSAPPLPAAVSHSGGQRLL